MINLRPIIAASALTLSLAATALAECDPVAPGQIPTVPCASAPRATDDPVAPGQIPVEPATDTATGFVVYVTEAALIELLILW